MGCDCRYKHGQDMLLLLQGMKTLTQHMETLMADSASVKQQLADQSAKIDKFAATVDTFQLKVVDYLAERDALIADLRSQIAAGASPATLQEIADGLAANDAKLAAAETDLEGTFGAPGQPPPPAPPAEEVPPAEETPFV